VPVRHPISPRDLRNRTPEGSCTSRLLIGVWILATVGLVLVAGCVRHPTSQRQAVRTEAPSLFVGSAVCAACHAQEAETHRISRHATTLHLVDRSSPEASNPPARDIPQTAYIIRAVGEGFQVALKDAPQRSPPLQLAFGSGKTGITYVSLLSSDTLEEARLTYFPHQHRWHITPGQEWARDQELGRSRQGDAARQCVLCHAVTLPDHSLMPEKRFLGVGCESCHGPGGAHVAAMQAGNFTDLHMEKIDRWSATQINEFCGKCHTAQGIESLPEQQSITEVQTQRFQAYGLMQSACFTQGQTKLSCISCHDPHTDASHNPRTYEAVCLQCHTAHPSQTRSQSVRGKVCPVNASSGCIGCHMPLRKAFPDTDIPTVMADHRIHVQLSQAR